MTGKTGGLDARPRPLRPAVVGAFVASMVFALAGCGESMGDKYKKIKKGMSEAEVEAVLGGKGQEGRENGLRRAFRVDAEGKKVDVESGLVWRTWRRGDEAVAVGFKSGKVVEKAREQARE